MDTTSSTTRSIWEFSVQRQKVMEVPEGQRVDGPKEVAELLRVIGIADKDQEHLVAIHLDGRTRVRGYTLVVIGLVDGFQAHAREIFRTAIIDGASRIILGHNHTCGDASPSPRDISSTKQLVKAGEILGIEVLDHVIIGQPGADGRDYFSLAAHGLL